LKLDHAAIEHFPDIDEIFMKPFENGSTVKLTDRYAKTLEKARGNPNWSVG
jgi:hypothetical protein